MKILIFIERLWAGGKERRLVELIKQISQVPDIEIQLVLTQKKVHYNEIYKTGIKIHYLLNRRIKKDPRIFFKFYKVAKNFKPDIIHVWGNVVALYAIPAKVFLNIPMINNQITDAPLKASRSFIGPRTTFKFSDRIIANSYAGIESYNAPLEKSIVIYNGFDFSRLNNLKDKNLVREKYNIKTDYVIAMVATFNNRKDYESYLEAANFVLNENENVTFLCIGSGDYSIYQEMVNLENKDKVLFLGKLQNVEDVMNICDIGILATYTEGIPNVILEFMALKKPVIATGGGGCKELIEDGKNGYLMKSKNVKGLEEKINYILNNKKLAKEYGDHSFEIVKNKFNIEKMITEYLKVYSEFE